MPRFSVNGQGFSTMDSDQTNDGYVSPFRKRMLQQGSKEEANEVNDSVAGNNGRERSQDQEQEQDRYDDYDEQEYEENDEEEDEDEEEEIEEKKENRSLLSSIFGDDEKKEDEEEDEDEEEEEASHPQPSNGRIVNRPLYKNERPQFGRSLLSPENELNKEIEQDDGRVSPFSSEYTKRKNAKEDDLEEQMEAIATNRMEFYIIFLLIAYILALCIGYHNTAFVGHTPQILTMEQRYVDEYLGKIDEYILALQNLHSESLDNVENYTQDIMGASELVSELKKSNEKIEKMKEEISDIQPPDRYEHFQSQLLELYSQQAALNSTINGYAQAKNDDTFKVVYNMNEKYEEANENFLGTYNKLFIK